MRHVVYRYLFESQSFIAMCAALLATESSIILYGNGLPIYFFLFFFFSTQAVYNLYYYNNSSFPLAKSLSILSGIAAITFYLLAGYPHLPVLALASIIGIAYFIVPSRSPAYVQLFRIVLLAGCWYLMSYSMVSGSIGPVSGLDVWILFRATTLLFLCWLFLLKDATTPLGSKFTLLTLSALMLVILFILSVLLPFSTLKHIPYYTTCILCVLHTGIHFFSRPSSFYYLCLVDGTIMVQATLTICIHYYCDLLTFTILPSSQNLITLSFIV